MFTYTITNTILDEEFDKMTGAVRDTLADEIFDILRKGTDCEVDEIDENIKFQIAMEIYTRLKNEITEMYHQEKS